MSARQNRAFSRERNENPRAETKMRLRLTFINQLRPRAHLPSVVARLFFPQARPPGAPLSLLSLSLFLSLAVYAFLLHLLISFFTYRRLASGRLWLQIGMSGWLTGEYSLRCQPVDTSDRPSAIRVGDSFPINTSRELR